MQLATMGSARIRLVILIRVSWGFLTTDTAASLGAYRCLRLNNRDWHLYTCLGACKTIADGYPEKSLRRYGIFSPLTVRLAVLRTTLT